MKNEDTPRFVVSEVVEGIVTLSPDQSHHLSRVLRLKTGAPVILIDGKGVTAEGEVSQSHGKHAQVLVKKRERVENTSRIGIAFALPKPQALDFVVRRCTEVGVNALQPLITDHSAPAKHWNSERWHRIVEEVSKQCQRPYFPEVPEPLSLSQFLSSHKQILVCDEHHRQGRPPFPAEGLVWGVIGPEGGWSVGEREQFEKSDAHFLGLGLHRLRTETACLVAATLLMESAGEIV